MDLLRNMQANRAMASITPKLGSMTVQVSKKQEIIDTKPPKKVVKEHFEELINQITEESDSE